MNNKINSFAFSSLIIILIVASFLGMGIYCITLSSRNDAYLSLILGSIVGLIIVICFIKLFNYEPTLPINKKIIKLTGKKVGTIINSYIVIKYFLLGSSAFYNLLNLISTQFLSETPALLIGSTFALVLIWANIKGIKTISNVSSIILIINILLLVSVMIPLTGQMDLTNLLPFLNNGLPPVLKGCLYFLTINVLPIFSLLIIPNSKISIKNQNKTIFTSYFISILITLFMLIYTISILGIYATTTFQYPEYIVLKEINVFNFIDRVENIAVLQWIFGLYIYLCINVYYISKTIKQKKRGKILPFLITILLLIMALKIFDYNVLYLNIIYNYLPYIRLITIMIIITLTIKVIIKQRKSHTY